MTRGKDLRWAGCPLLSLADRGRGKTGGGRGCAEKQEEAVL